jgi:trk system potassium uptake protein TrkH
MMVITIFSVFLNRKIGLHERQLLAQSSGAMQIGGVVRLAKRIFATVFIIEAIGAIIFAFRFCPQMGFVDGIWNAIFHSISIFCNAGFDLMGR